MSVQMNGISHDNNNKKPSNGPDQIIPAENLYTADPTGCVKIRMPNNSKDLSGNPPLSVPGLLKRTVSNYPDSIALCTKLPDGKWHKITYREYQQQVRLVAKAFIALGLERYHSVCILGFNSPEWFISDLAAIHAGGFAAGIYTTNTAEACFYCAENSRANIIVVQDSKQLEKILSIKSRLPHLKAIIQYEGIPDKPDVLSWKRVLQIGREQSDEKLENVLKTMGANECCTLVYTSGTVGNPKAVMLTHDNLTWDAIAIGERIGGLKDGMESIVSYLPLSHVAAQVVDIYITMSVAASVHFADPNALKGSLVNTLKEVRPTRFLAVPRVWEKMHEKMMQIAASGGIIQKMIASWAKNNSLQHYMKKMNGVESSTFGYSVASSVIFKKIKEALGLERCKTFVSAAAPLAADIKKYFFSIDLPIMEAFGMSEAAGAHTLGVLDAFGFDTIGPTIPGMQTKLHNKDAQGHGEICMYGRHVFMGYLNEPEKTKDTLDEEGWLHSGDIGRIDERGLVYITGRLKELLITAGGENVPPVPIEQLVKAELQHVSNCVLIGDKRKFLSLLVTLKTEVDPDTAAPLDKLTPEVKDWLSSLGCPASTIPEVLKAGPDPKLLQAIQGGIDRVNKQATSNAQKIQKFALLPKDFSIPTGELGPTLKLKRNVILEKYGDIIDRFYD
ncbi:long-chain-fatty-acid--CoA ligase ACSBG2 [Onthophagus taurus]|uniref:long-chain-fatty-acid--CoA ligase ACSBG2 n=1 Tax=Onthophagus taurus TaxID=166361 RepID=UPI000C200317|nr:long-chain-fatty-acid--CoA ligase ACSBG2 [Onthophagus taurus]